MKKIIISKCKCGHILKKPGYEYYECPKCKEVLNNFNDNISFKISTKAKVFDQETDLLKDFENKLHELLSVCFDTWCGEVWIEVERVYETRWDCISLRREAA